MKTYRVQITGKTPLLMHADNVAWSDQMKKWEMDPTNKAMSTPGDDRTPPFRWLGALYHDSKVVVVPSDNVMSGLMVAGALMPTGKGQKTFKAQSQSGIMAPELNWTLLLNGKPVSVEGLLNGWEKKTWDEFNEEVAALGFTLYVKRAKVGNSKHVRVRPRFDAWSLVGQLIVTDEAISRDVMQKLGELAGIRAGLCEWRPSSPKKPGPHGMFEWRVTPA